MLTMGIETRVQDLNEGQRGHLAYRLDTKTACGLGTASRIARGETMTNMTLAEIFEWAGRTPHSAKIHARKVINFRFDEHRYAAGQRAVRFLGIFYQETRGLTAIETRQTAEATIKGLQIYIETMQDLSK